MQEIAQVAVGLRLGGILPQQASKIFARRLRIAMEHEESEERLQAWRRDPGYGLAIVNDTKITEELDAQRGHTLQTPLFDVKKRPGGSFAASVYYMPKFLYKAIRIIATFILLDHELPPGIRV
jgi:hypothetical protein